MTNIFTRFHTTVKKIPYLGSISEYFVNTMLQTRKHKPFSTFFNFTNNISDDIRYRNAKIHPELPMWRDRWQEIREFFHTPAWYFLVHYLINGTPNTQWYKVRMEKSFDEIGTDPENLKRAYEKNDFMYVNRLMLRYHLYGIGEKIEKAVRTSKDIKRLRVLDYGCGVADASVWLALNGAKVTIVDLQDKKFDFAKWRFAKRKLKVEAIGAVETEKPVRLRGLFDVIIMAEFLEHVRNPQLFLAQALKHLKKGGYLYDSLGAVYNHGVGGEHLPETMSMVNNPKYRKFYNLHLRPTTTSHIYIKK